MPINHLVVIRESIADERPDVVREVWRLLKESRAAAGAIYESGDADPLRFGISKVRQSFETLVGYAIKQKLITERISPDDVFAKARSILGAAAE